MKAYFPPGHSKHKENKFKVASFWAKALLVGCLSLLFTVLFSKGYLSRADDSLFGLFHNAQPERKAPSSVIIVRLLGSPETYHGDSKWPSDDVVDKGIKIIGSSKPKAIFIDYSIDRFFSAEVKESVVNIADKLPTAIATMASTADLKKEGRIYEFPPDDLIKGHGISYIFDANSKDASHLSFSKISDYSKESFLGAWSHLTGADSSNAENNFINFYGEAGTINNITVEKLASLPEDETKSLLAGKIVFLGFQTIPWNTSPRGGDVKTSSYNTEITDTEVRATIAANLLDNSHIKVFHPVLQILVVFLLLSMLFWVAAFRLGMDMLQNLILFIALITATQLWIVTSVFYWIPGLPILYLAAFSALFVNMCLHHKRYQNPHSEDDDMFSFGKCKF